MISWIQRTFQHHFRLIFALLLVGMVVPFIFTIGSTPGIGRADRRAVTADFFGHNLASQAEHAQLDQDARLSALLQGASGMTAEQLQYYAYQRLAALHFADVMHIPPADGTEVANYIKTLRMFAGADGQFDVARYDGFRASLKDGRANSESEIARVLADDVRANKVERYLAGPGYVLPSEVRDVLIKGDTTWTLSTAALDYASFSPGISLSDSQVAKFFSDNSFRYTIAPRVSAEYVDFPWQAYVSESTPTDAEVRKYFDDHPGRFPKPAPAKAPAAAKPDPAADFAAVQPQVRAALQMERAKRLATKAASDLTYALYEGKVARGAPLDAFLAGKKLKVTPLAPFTLEAGPAELGGSHEIAAAAFELNADRFYSEGLPSPDGAVVLIWKESLPAREPLLAEVRDKVRADALDNEKRKRFVEFGQAFRASIERRLKAGESFDKAAVAAASPNKVEVKSYPAFSLRTQPHDIDPAVIPVLDHLEKGGVSDLQPTADKGLVIYAADKKLPALDAANPRYAMVKAQLAMSFARTDSLSILGEIVDKEVKRMDASLK